MELVPEASCRAWVHRPHGQWVELVARWVEWVVWDRRAERAQLAPGCRAPHGAHVAQHAR